MDIGTTITTSVGIIVLGWITVEFIKGLFDALK